MLLKKFSYSVLTRGLVAIINFFVLIVSSRYLGVETRGEISLLLLNIANIQMISEIFTGYALVHFIPKFSLKKIFLYGLVWIILIISIGSMLLGYLGYLIPNYEWEFVIVSTLIILNTFFMVINLGKSNIRLYNWLSILQPLLLLVVLSFNIFVEKKLVLSSYFDALFYSFGTVVIINSVSVFQYLKKDHQTEFTLSSIFSNGFLSQWGNWMHLLSNRFSYYILSSVALQSLGIYSTATSLIESVFVIYTGISTVVLSYVSNIQDKSEAQRITIQSALMSFILSLIAIIVLLLIPESWLLWILGKGFMGIKPVMCILALGALMISYSAVFSHFFSAIGVLKYNAISNTIACLFTILFSSVFIKIWGIKGGSIVASISYTIEAILVVYFFIRHNKINNIKLLFNVNFLRNLIH